MNNNNMLLRYCCPLILLALLPVSAYAHVKWFIPLESDIAPLAFSWQSPAVWTWIAIGLVLLSLSWRLHQILPSPRVPDAILSHLPRMLSVATGVSLVLASLNLTIIAPHLSAVQAPSGLLWLQSATGLLLITGRCLGLSGLLLLSLGLFTGLAFGWINTLEYLNISALGLCFLLLSLPGALRAHTRRYALPTLRIGTGLALVTLGLSEKLLNPHYALHFLSVHEWNFMARAGVDAYTDHLFVLSAGAMEVIFGLILILGTTVRLNVLAISVFMVVSNIAFAVQGHYHAAGLELAGHLPLIAIAVTLLLQGSGGSNIDSLLKKSILDTSFIPLSWRARHFRERQPAVTGTTAPEQHLP